MSTIISQLKPLKIGDLTARLPIIQGGMGVGISLSSLAGSVAAAGGVGIISTAQIGFREPDFEAHPKEANLRAIVSELKKAREIAKGGVVGFNIMVATKNYADYVRTAVRAGADLIISGAGLPVSLPEYVKGTATRIAPIVSSVKAAAVICRMWDRKYHTAPDMVVVEGPLAGGHLGFDRDKLTELEADTPHAAKTFHQGEYDEEVRGIIALVREYARKYEKKIPVVTAGGIYEHADVMHQMELGADGVQVATRFVTTEECDAPMSYKQAYIDAREEDIVIVKSPVGMPGRAIKNAFLKELEKGRKAVTQCYQCLEHCDPSKIPYCITQALVNAACGDEEHALIFCGGNAWRAEKIETVEDVMRSLCAPLPDLGKM